MTTGEVAATSEVVVARVAVDVPLAHLDRPFDYLVPEELRDQVRPGVRVRVKFAGRRRDGYVLAVSDHSDTEARLKPLERVVSPEVVLTQAIAGLIRDVADRYAGTFADVVRLAVPPRHGVAEKARRPDYPLPVEAPVAGPLAGYPDAAGYLDALARGGRPRASWRVVPVTAPVGDWALGVLEAAAATLASGRGSLIVVPDATELDRVEALFATHFGRGAVVRLTADAGPAARYRRFLAVVRGQVKIVVGTRAAIWAPIHDLGLIAVWDDGDDRLSEPRAPYPHVREVAALRASREGSGLLLAGYAVTAETQALVERGWLHAIGEPPASARQAGPAVRVTGDDERALASDPFARAARIPHEVYVVIRAALAQGPVLLQVPRAGYASALACQTCRARAVCPVCSQPLTSRGGGPECPSCGPRFGWTCPVCRGTTLRAPIVGVHRTAEEFGRAFPNVAIASSSAGKILREVGDTPQLVLATPGAEPLTPRGFSAAILLDTGMLLGRADLRASEEALRRWLAVTALVRPGAEGGTVLAVGDPTARALQALVRLDPEGFATRELAERRSAGFPPAAKWIVLDGPPEVIDAAGRDLRAALGTTRVLGPSPTDDPERLGLTLRAPLSETRELVAAVRTFEGVRSAKKLPGGLRVRVDPQVIA